MDVYSAAPGTNLRASAREKRQLKRLIRLAALLDARYRVPGTGWKFGLDGLIGLVPGVGDAASAAISIWIVWQASRLGASKRTLLAMLSNVGVDALIGAVPVIGDVLDVAYKANLRNVALLQRDLETGNPE